MLGVTHNAKDKAYMEVVVGGHVGAHKTLLLQLYLLDKLIFSLVL